YLVLLHDRYLQVANGERECTISPSVSLRFCVCSGRVIFEITRICMMTLRKIALNILRKSRIRQPDRQSIVANLKSLLTEGVPFRLYRLDIRSFYESLDTSL